MNTPTQRRRLCEMYDEFAQIKSDDTRYQSVLWYIARDLFAQLESRDETIKDLDTELDDLRTALKEVKAHEATLQARLDEMSLS